MPPLLTDLQPVPVAPPVPPPVVPFRPVVIARPPVSADEQREWLSRLPAGRWPVLLVGTGTAAEQWAATDPAGRTVLSPAAGASPAATLRAALAEAAALGYSHGLCVDGGEPTRDLAPVLEQSRARPNALVLGTRSRGGPWAARARRWAVARLLWIETGHTLADGGCPVRVYPLPFLPAARCSAAGRGLDVEMVARGLWAGVPVVQVPVATAPVDPPSELWRAVATHARLLVAAANPLVRHRRSAVGVAPPRGRSLGHRLFRWINPVTAWRQARADAGGRARFAAAFAAGIFIGCVPWYGAQTLLSLFVARRFRLHPAGVIGGSNLSGPPIGVPLVPAAVAVGHFLLHGSWPTLTAYRSAGMLRNALGEWVVGAVVVGLALAALAFVAVDLLLRALPDPNGDD